MKIGTLAHRFLRVLAFCAFAACASWIVPARVEGAWRTVEGELTLEQKYQMVTGVFRRGAAERAISGGKLSGDEIRFASDGAEYRGRVGGNVIEGTVAWNGGIRPWKATR